MKIHYNRINTQTGHVTQHHIDVAQEARILGFTRACEIVRDTLAEWTTPTITFEIPPHV